MKVRDVTSGAVLVGKRGGHSLVLEDAYWSQFMTHSWVIETEHGPLYLTPDEEVEAL